MHQELHPRSRRVNLTAIRRKLARERVANYLPDLKRWRSNAIQLRALVASRHHQAASELPGDIQLEALRREIELAWQAIVFEMDDIRDTPAAIDFLAAADSML